MPRWKPNVGERLEGGVVDRRRPSRRCGTPSRTAPRSCPRSRRCRSRPSGRRRRGAAARGPGRGTARRWWRPAARRRRRRATPRAPRPGRGGSRRRGSPRCCDQRAFTLGTPRRVSASSITSSWYSEPRCTSSTETPPVIGVVRRPVRGPWRRRPAQTARAGRSRLPPAAIRWPATSERKGSSARTEARSAASTRSMSGAIGAKPRASSGDMRRRVRRAGNKDQAGSAEGETSRNRRSQRARQRLRPPWVVAAALQPPAGRVDVSCQRVRAEKGPADRVSARVGRTANEAQRCVRPH